MASGECPTAKYLPHILPGQPPLRRASSFDRFIPFRPSLDVEVAHHKLLQGRRPGPSLARDSPLPPFSASIDLNVNVNADGGNNNNSEATPMHRAAERSWLPSTRSLSLDNADWPRPTPEYKRRLSVALVTGDLQGAASRILPFSCHTPPHRIPALAAFNSRRE